MEHPFVGHVRVFQIGDGAVGHYGENIVPPFGGADFLQIGFIFRCVSRSACQGG